MHREKPFTTSRGRSATRAYPREYVRAVLEAKLHVTVQFAGAVARVLGTDLSVLTQGT